MKIIEVNDLKEVPVGCWVFDHGITAAEAIARLKKREVVPEVIYKLLEQIHVPKEK